MTTRLDLPKRENFNSPPLVRVGTNRWGRALYRLENYLVFDVLNDQGKPLVHITVPRDYVTDLASVPRIFWSLIPPDGNHARSSIVHDYLCDQAAKGVITRFFADTMYRIALEKDGVKWLKRNVLYYGVRNFGIVQTFVRRWKARKKQKRCG